MADYNYSHDRVKLGGDTGDNNASGLGGYSLDVSPDGKWPGMSADPNKQRLNADDMITIAQTIDNYVEALQNSGAAEIPSKAAVSFGPDSWQAAVYLKDASGQVAKGVSEYTTKLISNLQAASTAIKNASGKYSGAESANQQGAANQQRDIDTQSTAY